MKKTVIMCITVAIACNIMGASSNKGKVESFTLSRAEIIEKTLKPYDGVSNEGVDTSSLYGKVMCGYQGWFTCPGDGSGMGWFHWGLPSTAPSDDFYPGRCSIDYWPDMSEYSEKEKFPTKFRHADGSVAYVFSSMVPETVSRHFKWMKDYGISGAFVQRFGVQTIKDFEYHNVNVVLNNCRAAANKHGRAYALMYDLSGLDKGEVSEVIKDWKLLVDKMKLTRDSDDKAYLHHKGKPIVAVWGAGFKNREYTLEETYEFIKLLKSNTKYGNCTVMLGLPTHWRNLDDDATSDPLLHNVIKAADIISPWMVGRIRKMSEIKTVNAPLWKADMEWCRENNLDYLPVVFPGFSWGNMQGWGYNLIPRQKGKFLWKQYHLACELGAKMIYQAMFDEVDEGTAIFKCTNNPPVGESKFLTYEGLPSDYYLWLVGQGQKMLRNKIPLSGDIPGRKE